MTELNKLFKLIKQDPETFICAWLQATTAHQNAHQRTTFLRQAITYSMVFNNYTVALLCSGLLGTPSDMIPSDFYHLGAGQIQNLAQQYPEFAEQLNLDLFPLKRVSPNFYDTFVSFKPSIQQQLILWATDPSCNPPERFDALRSTLLMACEQEEVPSDEEEHLRNTLLLMLSYKDDQELKTTLEQLLVKHDDDNDDNYPIISSDTLIAVLFSNPLLLTLVSEADVIERIKSMINITIRAANPSDTLQQLRLAMFSYSRLVNNALKRSQIKFQYDELLILHQASWSPAPLLYLWLGERAKAFNHYIQYYDKFIKETADIPLVLSPQQCLSYFMVDLALHELLSLVHGVTLSPDCLNSASAIADQLKLSIKADQPLWTRDFFKYPMTFELINNIKDLLPERFRQSFNVTCLRVYLSDKPPEQRLRGNVLQCAAQVQLSVGLGQLPKLLTLRLMDLRDFNSVSVYLRLLPFLALILLVMANYYMLTMGECDIGVGQLNITYDMLSPDQCKATAHTLAQPPTGCFKVPQTFVYHYDCSSAKSDVLYSMIRYINWANDLTRNLGGFMGCILMLLALLFGLRNTMPEWKCGRLSQTGLDILRDLSPCLRLLTDIIQLRQQHDHNNTYLAQFVEATQCLTRASALPQGDNSAFVEFYNAFCHLRLIRRLPGIIAPVFQPNLNPRELMTQLHDCVDNLDPIDWRAYLTQPSKQQLYADYQKIVTRYLPAQLAQHARTTAYHPITRLSACWSRCTPWTDRAERVRNTERQPLLLQDDDNDYVYDSGKFV